MAAPQPAHVRLFTADIAAQEEWPRWYYQDLHGELQGPFDAATMSRWCGENALPLDLKCVGIHPQDSGVPPTNIAHFQPLQKLLDNAEAGIRYTPLRLIKGTLSEEGPATPQGAAPGKGSRPSPAGTQIAVQQPSTAATDVTRAVDQRTMMGGLSATAAQQLHMQGQGLLQQLQQNNRPSQTQQRTPAMSVHQSMQMQQQNRVNSGKRGNNANPTPSQSLHEQHMQHMMQQAAAASAPKASENDGADAAVPELSPGSPDWNSALNKLLNREGFSGKDADVKWRVILSSGDRVGPFTPQQMVDWLLMGNAPKGINKQQASQHAANPTALQLAGILSADYNAQRLPGAKFFKPLGQLVPAVAAGMVYAAVNKHDLQRGLPQPGWNDGPGKGPVPAACGPAAAGPAKGSGGQQAGKAGKNRVAAASAGGATGPSAGKNRQTPTGNNRPRSAAGAAVGAGLGGFSNHVDGPAAAKQAFQHPMALRQQQRQQRQEGMNAVAAGTDGVMGGFKGQPGAAQLPRGPGGGNAPGMQTPKAFAGNRQSAPSGSASKGILMAANSVGVPAGALQQQQLTPAQAAAFAAAAGRLGPGGLAQMQQQQLQMQMQGMTLGTPSAAYAQSLQQAMWLKQQQMQMPGQGLLGGYQMYAANPGVAAGMVGDASMAAGAAAAGQLLTNGAIGRTSSTGSNKTQQQLQGEDSGNSVAKGSRAYPATYQQQLQDWQQQQQQYVVAGQQIRPGTATIVSVAGSGPQSSSTPHSSAALMQAAATLFLHDSQQQDQSAAASLDRPQAQWWVQRGERAFAGPYSGPQMYQMYLHAVPGSAQFTTSTMVAAVSGLPSSRDVPNPRSFVALGVLLEAAMQGYCLVPSNKDPAMQQQPLQVRHVANGMVVPLQQVVPAPLLQQRSLSYTPHGGLEHGQSDGSSNSDGQLQQKAAAAGLPMHGGVSPASLGGSRTGSSAGPTSPQQSSRTATVIPQPKMITTPAGSYIAIAAPVPAAGGALGAMNPVPAMGGMLAAPGMSVMAPATTATAMDPLMMATALFTGNSSYLWFTMSPAAEPMGPPRTTGPHEPTEMLAMFKDGRVQLNTLVSGVHRALINQQQPQQHRFEPLQMVLASHFTQQQQQQQQQQMNAAAVVAGGQVGQIVPAYVPGAQMGPMFIPVSAAGGAQLMAVPAGVQMQQMHMLPQMQAMAPFLQQGGMLVQQPVVGPAAGNVASVASAVQPQGQQVLVDAAAGGGSATGSSSNSSNVVGGLVGSAAPGQMSDANRSGTVPTRVDTWGSLAAAQELAHKRVSSGSGGQMQQQIQQQMSAGAQAVEAALAASSRRASGADSFHPHAGFATALAWQQQQHGPMSGPRSGGSFTQYPHQQQTARRTSSGSGRANQSGGPASSNGLDAAAAVAAALGHPTGAAAAGNLGLQVQFGQQSGAMTAIPEHQQQQKQASPGGSDEAAAVAVPDGAVSNGSTATADAAAGEAVAA